MNEIVRIQQKLSNKKEELTQVKEELSKLNGRKRLIETEINQLKQELELVTGNKSNGLSSFASQQFPWSSQMDMKLTSVFGIQSFRSQQRAVINATMSKLDTILIMPTGGGKSLCFQLPAILCPNGITLVISPLVALMEDQIQSLQSLNIPGGLLNSSTDKFESKRLFQEMIDPMAPLKLLYVTPERLAKSKRFMSQLEKMYKLNRLTRLVIDECHCCSTWGHDFRPDYKFLGILRRQFPGVPILGLTATATSKVTLDIQKMLNIEGCLIFRDGFLRPNLKYEVYDSYENRVDEIGSLIKTRFPTQSGIIYCLTISDVESLTKGLKALGIRCEGYHAQLDPQDRTRIQKRWYNDIIQIIIATVAFGMGINKLNVHYVIHYSISKSLENFYQESGRGGRDGEIAYCILFYSLGDVFRATSMMMTEKRGVENVYNMLRYCLDRKTCRKGLIANHFGDDWESCGNMCDNCQNNDPSSRLIDIGPYIHDLLLLLHHAEEIEQRMTLIKLMNAWFSKGDKKLRLDSVKVPQASKEFCERILAHLLLDGYITEEFHFTPYATISHLVPGNRKYSEQISITYDLPHNSFILSTRKLKIKSIHTTSKSKRESDTRIGSSCKLMKMADVGGASGKPTNQKQRNNEDHIITLD